MNPKDLGKLPGGTGDQRENRIDLVCSTAKIGYDTQ